MSNAVWLKALRDVYEKGDYFAPRGLPTHELLGYKTVIEMSKPIISIAARKLGYHFMAAEAAWILSGDNRVATIAPYSKAISGFSDDGIQFYGAYGPRIRSQLPHIISALTKDALTRQAVLSIWRESPPPSKDIPCTLTAHWMVRESQLHCFINMRSSDLWLGVPYDWFNFSMLSAYVLLMLRQTSLAWDNVELGKLCFTANSQHLYDKNVDAVEELTTHVGSHKLHDVQKFDILHLEDFREPDDLIQHLWNVANGTGDMSLSNFMTGWEKKDEA